MKSTLITGGSREDRLQKTRDIAQSYIKGEIEKSPDYIIVVPGEDESSIGIEKIRELKSLVQLTPRGGAIIVHIKGQFLTLQAQNALLKVLEEPPALTRFIITARHETNLIPTIVSRCLKINLPLKAELTITTELLESASIINLLTSPLGERLDWVAENLEKIKTVEYLEDIFTLWQAQLRDVLISRGEGGIELFSKDMVEIKIKSADILKNMDNIYTAQTLLKTNCDKRLLVERVLLNLIGI